VRIRDESWVASLFWAYYVIRFIGKVNCVLWGGFSMGRGVFRWTSGTLIVRFFQGRREFHVYTIAIVFVVWVLAIRQEKNVHLIGGSRPPRNRPGCGRNQVCRCSRRDISPGWRAAEFQITEFGRGHILNYGPPPPRGAFSLHRTDADDYREEVFLAMEESLMGEDRCPRLEK